MTPATNARLLEQVDADAARLIALPVRAMATISTPDGRFVTGGILEITHEEGGWRGRLRHLDRPGLVAALYFSDGIRDVLVRLEDGRHSVARIAGTSFVGGSQRVCELRGSAPLV